MTDPDRSAAIAGAVLRIDLDAVAENWRILRDRTAPGECGGVVKANAYGLGIGKVAPVLYDAGCRSFFVAQIGEGIELRRILPDVRIVVLNGLMPDTAPVFLEHRLVPALNTLNEVSKWARLGRMRGGLEGFVHIDTGMSRLGLDEGEANTLIAEADRLDGISPVWLMTHLACADEPGHPTTALQGEAFAKLATALPVCRTCFANSSGIFLGEEFSSDLARPGVALYGANPTPDKPNPMRQVVELQAKILQVRQIDTPRPVGYGSRFHAQAGTVLATAAVGYADGYLRSLSGKAVGFIDGVEAPLAGRVSMDTIIFDVSEVPEESRRVGATIELIGPNQTIDDVATRAGTIGYEILTSLGDRYARVYHRSGKA
jgi:alanine racemase